MAMNRTRLADIAYLGSSNAAFLTNGASTKTYVRGLILHNTNTTTETVDVYNVPDSGGSVGTAGNGNKFLTVNLAANETLFIELPHPITLIDTNDTLQGKSTTASKTTVQVLGDKDA